MKLFAPNVTDFYKTSHIFMDPKGMTLCYSNFTNRSDRLAKMTKTFDGKTVFVGLQGALKEITEMWNESFFSVPKEQAVKKYKRRMDNALGPNAVSMSHFEALHDLGYLPIEVKALPEGSLVNIKVPSFVVKSTHKDFEWVVNYLETVLSNLVWKPQTVATIAYEYKMMLERFAEQTGANKDFIMWQGHDFSMRGMSGPEDAARSSFGHLCSFAGTDTIPSIDYAEDYYNANSDKELIGGSVPASEHKVASANIITLSKQLNISLREAEKMFLKRYVTELYPTGVASYVSDTFNFWQTLEIAKELKTEIVNRQPNALGLAKVVFRPDSGNPTEMVCGCPTATPGSPEFKGAVELLWDAFGGTINEKGFKTLNQRVGIIYGDSITLQRAEAILSGLAEKGFTTDNIVFGIGSYTYNYNTRDTFGSAIKATYCEINDMGYDLYKDPITDNGVKKSAKGLLRVEKQGDDFVLFDQQTWEQEKQGMLQTVFLNGKMIKETSLREIRERLNK